MKKTTGKTYSIINRLPHFLKAGRSDTLTDLVKVFASRLEKAELDLYQVQKSHYVETASNEGSRGYTADNADRGDLDKLFAMMLEALGGTSCFTSLSPYLSGRLCEVRGLAKYLLESDDPVVEHILQYLEPEDLITLELYHVSHCFYTPEEIEPWFAQAILLGKNAEGGDSKVSEYIKELLVNDPVAEPIFSSYGGGDVPRDLAVALTAFLNDVLLRDHALFSSLFDSFKINPALDQSTWILINSVYNDFLREQYEKLPDMKKVTRIVKEIDGESTKEIEVFEENTEKRNLLETLDNAEPAVRPLSDDIIRLNRLLLDAEYGRADSSQQGFVKVDIPGIATVRKQLLGSLNAMLDLDDLFTLDLFPDLAEDFAFLKERFKDRNVWLNRVLLEYVFPMFIEKSYLPYRQRMTGLIRALAEGASTTEGIINVVANNLGIVGTDQRSMQARSLIKIKEFAPDEKQFYKGQLTFYQEFRVKNENQDEQYPELKLAIIDPFSYGISEVKIINTKTSESIIINDKDILQPDCTIIIKRDGIFIGEIKKAEVGDDFPKLPIGYSEWEMQIKVFDESAVSRTAGQFNNSICKFDETSFVEDEPIVDLEISSVEYQYGKFTIEIPWHIDGFTDLFEETPDHPRHQIQSLVNKVKAAGVRAFVAYKQVFTEDHNISERLNLHVEGPLLSEKHDINDDNYKIDSRQNSVEVHDVKDKFEPAGRFDYTTFDSLNTFK